MNQRKWGIGVYAPAGMVIDAAAIERAVARLEAQGHRVVVDPSCGTRWQRFSGSDEARLAAVLRMATDPRVEVAIAARGGYGWSRLLDRLDFGALARSRKRWIGHSDFTAFQLAALASEGMVTFAGPMAAYDFGAVDLSSFTWDHCWEMLASGQLDIDLALDGPDADLAGTLWGGNLALVAHLAGTRHLPQVDGGILVLEDIGEAAYRVERMLYQLHFAGILARQRAVLLGAFTGCEPGPNDGGYDLDAAVAKARQQFGVPIYTGFPFGHVRDKLTLPVGGRAALKVRAGRARFAVSEAA